MQTVASAADATVDVDDSLDDGIYERVAAMLARRQRQLQRGAQLPVLTAQQVKQRMESLQLTTCDANANRAGVLSENAPVPLDRALMPMPTGPMPTQPPVPPSAYPPCIADRAQSPAASPSGGAWPTGGGSPHPSGSRSSHESSSHTSSLTFVFVSRFGIFGHNMHDSIVHCQCHCISPFILFAPLSHLCSRLRRSRTLRFIFVFSLELHAISESFNQSMLCHWLASVQ